MEQQLNRSPDDSYALVQKEQESERETALDLSDTKADITSLITLRNDCNENERVRQRNGKETGRIIRESEEEKKSDQRAS